MHRRSALAGWCSLRVPFEQDAEYVRFARLSSAVKHVLPGDGRDGVQVGAEVEMLL